ncbi:hypothetical protein BU16DRAFT_311004 [Lophium mytilinum]|uniref:Uncharacterized protein n=1 Tax=Lophium mytilinum TaxID=390894 RepID=A0A6A6R1P0_9PEZI|nr:hypothetical protein BU16DRAFT_311004 [Lophium mytilinum]
MLRELRSMRLATSNSHASILDAPELRKRLSLPLQKKYPPPLLLHSPLPVPPLRKSISCPLQKRCRLSLSFSLLCTSRSFQYARSRRDGLHCRGAPFSHIFCSRCYTRLSSRYPAQDETSFTVEKPRSPTPTLHSAPVPYYGSPTAEEFEVTTS